jgi:hypothetical protein
VRIAIDARKLRDYGIGTYIRNLLRHLSRLDQSTEYACSAAMRTAHASTLGPNFRAVTEGSPAYSVHGDPDTARPPARARRCSTPHYVLPPLTPCRSVAAIHDCSHLRFPEYLPSRLATRMRAAHCGPRRRRPAS